MTASQSINPTAPPTSSPTAFSPTAEVGAVYALLAGEYLLKLTKSNEDDEEEIALSDIVTAEISRQDGAEEWGEIYGLDDCPSRGFIGNDDKYQQPSFDRVSFICDLFYVSKFR